MPRFRASLSRTSSDREVFIVPRFRLVLQTPDSGIFIPRRLVFDSLWLQFRRGVPLAARSRYRGMDT